MKSLFSQTARMFGEDSKSFVTRLEQHQMLTDDLVIRKVITRSQYLRQLAVRMELHWVPGHSGVEGNKREDAAAHLTAIKSDDGLIREHAFT
jgi:ribonuclease HI